MRSCAELPEMGGLMLTVKAGLNPLPPGSTQALTEAVVGQKPAPEALRESFGEEEENLPASPVPDEGKNDQGRREALPSDSKGP